MSKSGNEIKDFYDNFPVRLLTDYLYSNKRVMAALDFILGRIPRDAVKVLDIGCGIGWVSHEISRHFPNVSITALDLSPELVKTGRMLFGSDKINFAQKDVTSPAFTAEFSGRYDVVVMVDVYEHIPETARDEFNRALGKLLSPTGRIILTTPTVAYQEHLRENEPNLLQPVDENIDIHVVQKLGETTATEVEVFKSVRIWGDNDYQHICLNRVRTKVDFSTKEKLQTNIEGVLTKVMRVRKKVPDMAIDYELILRKKLGSIMGKKK